MNNLITKTTELAMYVALSYVKEGDIVIDATCGNGNDTVTLAKAAGPGGTVYAFDIQSKAINATEEKLRSNCFSNAELLNVSFTEMNKYVKEDSVSAIVFNLGYLPGGDHNVTTTADETLRGLNCALKAIRRDGIVTVVLYDGHEEGAEEKMRVIDWAKGLDPRKYHAAFVSFVNQKNHPPDIMWITKKK